MDNATLRSNKKLNEFLKARGINTNPDSLKMTIWNDLLYVWDKGKEMSFVAPKGMDFVQFVNKYDYKFTYLVSMEDAMKFKSIRWEITLLETKMFSMMTDWRSE